MVTREGSIYYDYVRQVWELRREALSDGDEGCSAGAFCPESVLCFRMLSPFKLTQQFDPFSSFNSLSQSAQLLLSYLACLPSRGVALALLERLMDRSEATVRSLIQECSTLGTITLVDQKVRFSHDKLHAGALAMIDSAERPRLLLKIARDLDGLSMDYKFLQADMLLTAFETDPRLISSREVAALGEQSDISFALRLC